MDKAILEMPMSKLISNLFQVGLKKNIFALPFSSNGLPMTLSLMATAINMGLKKRWRLKFLRIFPPLPHPATDPQTQCCWQLENLLFVHITEIGRIILQEWITQTVLLQFAVIHCLSDMLLFYPSYTKKIILTQRSYYLPMCWFTGTMKLMKPSVVWCCFIFELSGV